MNRSLVYRVFRRDVGRKLVALMLAVVVWLLLTELVSGERNVPLDVRIVATRAEAEQLRSTVPAVYVVVPEHLLVSNLVHKTVDVYFKGLRDEVDGLEPSIVMELPLGAVALDLSDDGVAEVQLTLEPRYVKYRLGTPSVNELIFDPRAIRIELVESSKETFDLGPWNVVVVGNPRTGHSADPMASRVEPNQVQLSGPRNALAGLRRDRSLLRLMPIDLQGQSIDVSRQVGLDHSLAERNVSLMTASGVVSVTVPVRPVAVPRQLFSVPVSYRNEDALTASGRYVLERTEALDLLVSGPPHVLDDYTDAQLKTLIQPTFDWRKASFGQASEQVLILDTLPDSVIVSTPSGGKPEISYRLAPLENGSPASTGDAP